jgi:hypothetical protein
MTVNNMEIHYISAENITICTESCKIIGGGKEGGRVTEEVELTKVKHIFSCEALRITLNINFGIKNERQDGKMCTVCVGRVNEGNKGEGT